MREGPDRGLQSSLCPAVWMQDLEGCQHTLIGDEMMHMKGISGGQRRRVSGGLDSRAEPAVAWHWQECLHWNRISGMQRRWCQAKQCPPGQLAPGVMQQPAERHTVGCEQSICFHSLLQWG